MSYVLTPEMEPTPCLRWLKLLMLRHHGGDGAAPADVFGRYSGGPEW